MKDEKRHRFRIYFDILSAIQEEMGESEEVKPTRVQHKVYVPYDRFKEYLKDLERLNMLESATSIRLTSKGRRYVKQYRKVMEFLADMGLITLDTGFLEDIEAPDG